jgi:hypothetical protein
MAHSREYDDGTATATDEAGPKQVGRKKAQEAQKVSTTDEPRWTRIWKWVLRTWKWPHLTPALSLPLRGPERECNQRGARVRRRSNASTTTKPAL